MGIPLSRQTGEATWTTADCRSRVMAIPNKASGLTRAPTIRPDVSSGQIGEALEMCRKDGGCVRKEGRGEQCHEAPSRPPHRPGGRGMAGPNPSLSRSRRPLPGIDHRRVGVFKVVAGNENS